MDNYNCFRNTKFDIKGAFDNSKSHKFQIKLNFCFNHKVSNWILHQDYSTTPELISEPGPSSTYDAPPLVVAVRKSLSPDDLREDVGKAIGDCLLDGELEQLIELAWDEVCKFFKTKFLPRYGVLGLACKILIEHNHVHVVESDCPRMVPAADSSFELLEKYEVDDGESCCCICLEELGGGGGGGGGEALRMPCLHAFHGGCIREWLGRSHYCPLCRYEMPTE